MTKQLAAKPRLGILVCGHSPDKVVEAHGRYNTLFEKLLGSDNFVYQPFFVVDNEFPTSINVVDAWLITGSRHGAYEDHRWIPPLEKLIQQIYSRGMPLVGICFGHQIMAQALGGRVEKHKGGWIAGTRHYTFDSELGLRDVVLNAWHQDQVIELPADAVVIGSSETCAYAALRYRNNTVSLQPHPEFDHDYMQTLIAERGHVLPADRLQLARQSMHEDLSSKSVAQWLAQVLRAPVF